MGPNYHRYRYWDNCIALSINHCSNVSYKSIGCTVYSQCTVNLACMLSTLSATWTRPLEQWGDTYKVVTSGKYTFSSIFLVVIYWYQIRTHKVRAHSAFYAHIAEQGAMWTALMHILIWSYLPGPGKSNITTL